MPFRQSYLVELSARRIRNAVALNSIMFNLL